MFSFLFFAPTEIMRFMRIFLLLCYLKTVSQYSLNHPSDSSIIIKINDWREKSQQRTKDTEKMMKRFDFNAACLRVVNKMKFIKKKKIYNSINRAKIINSYTNFRQFQLFINIMRKSLKIFILLYSLLDNPYYENIKFLF